MLFLSGFQCVLLLWGVTSSPVNVFGNNVQLLREGQLIKIIGDNLSNTITVSQGSTGNLIVSGRNGTSVNGQPSAIIRGVAINAMEVLLNGGNDRITFNNVGIANDLFLNLGAGDDQVLTAGNPSEIGANCTVEVDSGNEVVRLTGWSIGGDPSVLGGTGILNTTLSQLSVGFGLTVIGDNLNDAVSVAACEVGDTTSIETKLGNDRVTISSFIGFDLFVTTDRGNDTVSMFNVLTLEDVEVNTGTENDSVTMTTVSSGKNVKASLDAGADTFVGTNVSAAYDAVFEGGAGTDTFGDFGVLGGEKTEIKEFEIFL